MFIKCKSDRFYPVFINHLKKALKMSLFLLNLPLDYFEAKSR
ncbi:hypothetical protein D778_00994 [Xanthomarina gelatinilytica]|uniref:Uncharacterized protein n=1 Tax=Xanthomarina gelatinilytica TaxID=1137281 RepID=M7MXU2_9FLAO|nr:hypothetical protein D778_00994 [Xanthomarina gelatinilytica]